MSSDWRAGEVLYWFRFFLFWLSVPNVEEVCDVNPVEHAANNHAIMLKQLDLLWP